MIKYNHEYTYSRGNGKITFTEGKGEIVNATYKVFNDIGTISGKLDENKLEATFHSTSMNRVGLIHFTFSDDGFNANWKNGLEPGTMRGRWFTEKTAAKADSFIFDIKQTDSWNFEDNIEDEVERIFQLQDVNLRDSFIKDATEFINNHPTFYWLSNLIYYKAEECYFESGNDDLIDLYSGFQISEKGYKFNPKDFSITFHPERDSDNYWAKPSDYKWSVGNSEKKTFIETLLDILKIDISNYHDTSLNYALMRNAATSYLWVSLQKYSTKCSDSEDMANCLWSVFSESAHNFEIFKSDSNFCQEAVDNIIKYILRIDKEEFNADENPCDRDDLNSFNDYVHDYVKLSEEILDKDIFDM